MPRYTGPVGRWSVRVLSVVLITLLAGTPALAAVCDVLCSGDAQPATFSDATHGNSHHHLPVAEDSAAAPEHHRHRSAVAMVVNSSPELKGSSGHDCRGPVGQPAASLTAARADTGLRATSHVAALLSPVPLKRNDRTLSAPIEARPPGRSSPAPTPLVLRI